MHLQLPLCTTRWISRAWCWMKVKVTQSCPTHCDPMDYTVHGILQVRILEWVAIPFPRGSSQPRDRPRSPTLQVDSLSTEPPGKPKNTGVGSLSLLQGIFPTQELNQGLPHCRRVVFHGGFYLRFVFVCLICDSVWADVWSAAAAVILVPFTAQVTQYSGWTTSKMVCTLFSEMCPGVTDLDVVRIPSCYRRFSMLFSSSSFFSSWTSTKHTVVHRSLFDHHCCKKCWSYITCQIHEYYLMKYGR